MDSKTPTYRILRLNNLLIELCSDYQTLIKELYRIHFTLRAYISDEEVKERLTLDMELIKEKLFELDKHIQKIKMDAAFSNVDITH